MNLIPCGTIVKPKSSNIEMTITQISIRFDYTNYELSYFLNGKEEQVWMQEQLFDVISPTEKIKVGFAK